ncbi:TetR/AcrR family transcriptional regulator [Oceanibacterium hippocampi]|uniref:Fatty acid metabolism regulator protein n=1 Tax=Oceanibacterium hippocampi TaxID=745714 RepID=A0A1Y5SRF7_9PROT|nr:TetR/AcrR family transcriptional regulator [Oceanibacterium hippocampi]SLN46583.1 Fatty acid metabolism regulator protein [Oceanibacterium hippocampi]
MAGIEAAARSTFAEKGFDEASMAEIATRAGISEAAIYKYFDGKRHLLLTVLESWYRDMVADNRAKVAGVEGTRARIQVMIWQHLRTIRENPDLCRLFYGEVRSQPGYRQSELYELNRQVTGLMVGILNDGIEAGDLRDDIPVRLIRDVVFGGIEHHVAGFLAGRGELDCDAIATTLTSLVVDGIGAVRSPDAADGAVARLERIATRFETLLGPKVKR